MCGELHEALKAVIRSVDRLRDEVLPDICGRLREIESSPSLARCQEGATGPPQVRALAPRDRPPAQRRPHKKDEANKIGGGSRSPRPAAETLREDELRQVVAGLHERLEVRMQRMYEEHSSRWKEELEGLLKHIELARPILRKGPSWNSGTQSGSGAGTPSPPEQGRSTIVGAWRDSTGTFLSGRTITIAEDGWSIVDAARPSNAGATDPVEFLSLSKVRLLLPAEEGGSAEHFDMDLGADDTLTVNSMGNLNCTLHRVSHARPRRPNSPKEQSALNTCYKTPVTGSWMNRFSTSWKFQPEDLDPSGSLRLLNKTTGKFAFFRTRNYEVVQVVMIVLDAAFITWRTQRAAELLSSEPYESVTTGIKDNIVLVLVNDLFCFWYMVDLVGRALSQGRLFCSGAESALHCFEVFVVSAYLLEVIATHANYNEGYLSSFRFWIELVSFARTLRLLRLVHMSRFVRHNTAFRELRLMMYALQGALKSLVWSTVMLVVILLITGTVFTNGYIRHVVYNGHVRNPEYDALDAAFGTLSTSMFTLFKAVTGGVDWGEVYVLLAPLQWPYKGFYGLYQLFATLALLNVITAVFVESTMQRSGKDRESAVVEEINGRRELLARIDALFEEFDEDKDEQIKKDELKAHMQNKDIAAYFSSLGVDVDQVGKLFLLLDQDNSGFIDRQEFLQGCLRLKGEAKSVDLAVLQADVDLIVRDMQEVSELMHQCVGKIDLMNSL